MLFAAFCLVCLVALTVALVANRQRRVAVAMRPSVRLGPVELPSDRYYHPGHTWAKPVERGEVLVGLDAFARRLVGEVRSIEVPSRGEKLEQGRRVWALRFDGRVLEQPSPVDGEVVEVNEAVLQQPAQLREDPYEKGWILRVRPRDQECCAANLFSSDLAKKWVELAIQDLQRSYSPLAGAVFQDGGELVEGIARHLTEEQWERFRRRYFPVA
ncbi:MAG: glycine cleavage system protein H [candidate division KSB1 bacterium]|nr:glycine cleavage system protein H [candidate division KSB1 bacterium]